MVLEKFCSGSESTNVGQTCRHFKMWITEQKKLSIKLEKEVNSNTKKEKKNHCWKIVERNFLQQGKN